LRIREEAKPLEYYLELNYPVTLYRAEEGGFAAEIEDLQGCLTQGETIEEAIENIEEARQLWLKVAYEDGVEIPIPRTDEEYSGRFLVRIPKSLHRRLTEQARYEGVSLNQYVETILTAGTTCVDIKNEIKEILTNILGKQLVIGGTLGFGYQTGYINVPQWTLAREEELIEEKEVKLLKAEGETMVAL